MTEDIKERKQRAGGFEMGRRHGVRNLPYYSHRRRRRPYDSARMRESYERGYQQGSREREQSKQLDAAA